MTKEEKIETLKEYIQLIVNHQKEIIDTDFIEITNLQKQAYELLLGVLSISPRTIEDELEVGDLIELEYQDCRTSWFYMNDEFACERYRKVESKNIIPHQALEILKELSK